MTRLIINVNDGEYMPDIIELLEKNPVAKMIIDDYKLYLDAKYNEIDEDYLEEAIIELLTDCSLPSSLKADEIYETDGYQAYKLWTDNRKVELGIQMIHTLSEYDDGSAIEHRIIKIGEQAYAFEYRYTSYEGSETDGIYESFREVFPKQVMVTQYE